MHCQCCEFAVRTRQDINSYLRMFLFVFYYNT
nr:MAG TPA: hypothetical protein [Bacteriophage sp.]